MTEEPRSISAQRRTVPAHVEVAVEVALAKLPADRFASAADFTAALSGESVSLPRSHATAALTRPGRPRAATATLAAGLVIASALAVWGWLRQPPEQPVTRSYVRFPDAEPLFGRTTYTLLPDGSALVYVGKAENGGTQLWMKKRSELHATPLGGTSGASNVFASPDGKWLGFIAAKKLKKIPTTGGEPTTLADASCISAACTGGAESGAWLDNGRIAFVSDGILVTIPASGGPLDSIATSVVVGGLASILPVGLPGGRGLLFTSCTVYCNKSNVNVVDLKTRDVRMLVENGMLPLYSPTGHLLYVDAHGTGMAIPFDLSTLTTRGTPTPVLDRVAGVLSMSNDGMLAYMEGDIAGRADVVLVSRDGRSVQPVDSSWRGNFSTLALAPDGRRLAVSLVGEGQEHIWIKTVGGTAPVRLTYGATQNSTPTWTGDGASILFTRFEGARKSTFLSKRADGTGAEQTLESGANWVIESAASRDGEWLALRQYRPGGARDIYARRTKGDSTEQVVVATPTEDVSPSLSPDGKWMVYSSDEAGAREVWVVPFPDPRGAKWQVSTSGGYEPFWSRDGREIFYVTPNNEMVAVQVSTLGGVSAGKREVLFRMEGYRHHFTHRAYDVMPDGKHFIVIRDAPPAGSDLVLVDHWTAELAARLRSRGQSP